MKFVKYMVGLFLVASTLHATSNKFVGKYVCDKGRYVKTITLNTDGFGRWTYHHNKNSRYDFNNKISWKYNSKSKNIFMKDIEHLRDPNANVGGQTLLLKNNGFLIKGSDELYKKQ